MTDTAPNNFFTLAGRVAVVTGGAKGIGAGIVDVLAEAGATMVVADCDRDSADAHAADLAEAGHHAVAVSVDLADEASIIAASATITQDFGAPWLLVNNAALQDREFFLEASASHWDKIHAVNARGDAARPVTNQVLAVDGGFSII